MLPASAWQPGLNQDGIVQDDKHAAEITHLLSRAAGRPEGLRWIVRRTRPSRRQMPNLTTPTITRHRIRNRAQHNQ